MSRNRIVLIIGAIAAIGIIGFLVWLGVRQFQSSNQQSTDAFTFTNSVTGKTQTSNSSPQEDVESGKPLVQEPDTITISGLDTFFGTLDQTQANSILADLTTFIRSRVGAKSAQAGIVDAKVTKTGSNPNIYKFTMAITAPAASYNVTVSIPTDTNVAPQVSFEGVSQ